MQRKLYRSLSGLSLLILLGIPTFVPALHELLHYHRHLHCTASNSDVHLHADEYSCQICDYLTSFTFLNSPSATLSTEVEFCVAEFYFYSSPALAVEYGTRFVRGPPVELI